MRVAVVGANGQLGAELMALLGADAVPLVHADVEIGHMDSVTAGLSRAQPEFVINAAAYNLVDRAEDEPETAYIGNALGPRNLARYCGEHDIPLLHVSTDYVFGLDAARKDPLTEDDPAGPQSAYASSKLAGEFFVRSLCPRHYVVRTCGLYGRRAVPPRRNFVETMLAVAQRQDSVSVVDDQRCTPTSAADLALALTWLMPTGAYGLYHVTNQGSATWCEFARKIFEIEGLKVTAKPIRSAEYAAKARRPPYSVLNNGKFAAATGRTLAPWADALGAYLAGRRA